MALLIPPGFAHIAIQLRDDADPEPWYVTFGVDHGGLGTDLAELGAQCMFAYWDAWGNEHPPSVELTGCQITIGQDGPSPIRAFVNGDGDRGTDGGSKLPQNCALLVRKNTNQGGRRQQGRMFLPAVLNEDIVTSTGVILGSEMATLFGNALAMWSSLNTGIGSPAVPTPMVILHSEGISDAGEPTVVTGVSCDNVISTQRRRLR